MSLKLNQILVRAAKKLSGSVVCANSHRKMMVGKSAAVATSPSDRVTGRSALLARPLVASADHRIGQRA
jgi:hypothetical protein